jgi:ABC-type branched-subunit amino acid transport system permease subunit
VDYPENEADEVSADAASSPEGATAPQAPDPYEGAVPPGYDWPTHGGYLGCLLGLMAACLIGGFAAKLVGLFTFRHQITGLANVVLLLAVFAVATVIFTNLGWRLGRRFFREYAQKPTWGESDEPEPPATDAPPENRTEPEGEATPEHVE